MKKSLSDFPAYATAKNRLVELGAAHGRLSSERESIVHRLHTARSDVEAAAGELVKTGTLVDSAPPRERIAEIDRAIRIHEQAIELQRTEVEQARGLASVEICQQARPEFIKQIRIILECLKGICAANEQLDRLREELRREDVESGAIPHCTLLAIGSWTDREKVGSAFVYRTWIERSFPDVKI